MRQRNGPSRTRQNARSAQSIRVSSGALGRIRTSGPRNRNPMLYPAELRARAVRIAETARQFYGRTSEAGMPAAVLADIGGGALVAVVGGGAIVKGEGGRRDARTIIMHIADQIRQPVPVVIMVAVVAMMASAVRHAQTRRQGDRKHHDGSSEKL